ncbi:MAG: DUF134 domain-containing protein [Tenericutes bacterium]|nr:DUF134 domain-containing protein [Mycoplasmatota bacterium]
MPRFDGTGPNHEGRGYYRNGNSFCGNGQRCGKGRPGRVRRVGMMPRCKRYGPINNDFSETITMSVDEYEAIRLIDELGLNQEEASNQMNIARTTVQSIYATARKKLADSLINQKELYIEGGNFELKEEDNI